MNSPKSANEIDATVGQCVRRLREARGISQTQLGNDVGVTFQQIQKYEHGKNRISAGRMQQIADALGVGVAELYGEESPPQIPALDYSQDASTLKLLKHWPRLSESARSGIAALVVSLAEDSDQDTRQT